MQMSKPTQQIWKYPFEVRDTVHIEMPQGALVLDVQVQHGQPCIWAHVNPDAPKSDRAFRVFGTGHTMRGDFGRYCGTFQMDGGALVFHLYEMQP